MNTDFREIDLQEWELSGGGNQGESYNSRKDPTRMLKLYFDFFRKDLVVGEYELAREIQRMGIPSPRVFEMVKCGNRYGIVFQRIVNKKSLCRIIGEQPGRIPEIAKRLASAGDFIHRMNSDDAHFPKAIEYYRGLLTSEKPLDEHERARMEDAFRIVEREDGNAIVHGDFHFGNVITDGSMDYFIDMGTISKGNPKWDHSMLFMMCHFLPDHMARHIFHMTRANAEDFWKEYKLVCFGHDAPSDEEFMKEYAPYMYLRTLFFPDNLVEINRNFRSQTDPFF